MYVKQIYTVFADRYILLCFSTYVRAYEDTVESAVSSYAVNTV